MATTTSRTRADAAKPRDLTVDRLPEAGASLEVVPLADASFGTDSECGPRRPHRHDYHELIWTRHGEGHHLIDGEPSAVEPNTVTLIGRGQVHVFERAEGLRATVVRFGDEHVLGAAAPGWLLSGSAARAVVVPPGAEARVDALLAALADELDRPPDARSADLQGHLLSVLLLWFERWYDETRIEAPAADDADVQLHRRFAAILERDFARRHDAAHYADALGVPAAALARALARVTGRPTKALVLDRVMLEAARLLRFTEMSVGEIAFAVGYADPLYFSGAFKRQSGEAPMAYRDRLRGRA